MNLQRNHNQGEKFKTNIYVNTTSTSLYSCYYKEKFITKLLTSVLYFIQCNIISILISFAELTCYIVAGRTFVYYRSSTSGYIFGARLDVMYEQLLQNQEVTGV